MDISESPEQCRQPIGRLPLLNVREFFSKLLPDIAHRSLWNATELTVGYLYRWNTFIFCNRTRYSVSNWRLLYIGHRFLLCTGSLNQQIAHCKIRHSNKQITINPESACVLPLRSISCINQLDGQSSVMGNGQILLYGNELFLGLLYCSSWLSATRVDDITRTGWHQTGDKSRAQLFSIIKINDITSIVWFIDLLCLFYHSFN